MASTNAHIGLPSCIKVVAIDLDGVVYHGRAIIDGADTAVSALRTRGLQIVFVTNSSVRTRADVAQKLTDMGIPVREDDVLTSAYVAGLLVKSIGARTALIVGEAGLKQEIANSGTEIVARPPCDSVVVGMDTAFSYDKIRLAMEAIAGGAAFVACNRDTSFPGDGGHRLPGCGPMVAAIESAVGFPPQHVAGKPSALMLEIVADRFRVGPDEILVVGDSVDSDIAMATAFGSPSALVASDPCEFAARTPVPSAIISRLSDLPQLF